MIYNKSWNMTCCDIIMIYMMNVWYLRHGVYDIHSSFCLCTMMGSGHVQWYRYRFGPYLDLSITYVAKYCWRIYVTIASLYSILKLAKLPVTIHPLPFSHRKPKNYDYLWKNSIHIDQDRLVAVCIV